MVLACFSWKKNQLSGAENQPELNSSKYFKNN